MDDRRVLLALETSQRQQSIAVALGDGVMHCESVETNDRMVDDLMPAIDRAFQKLSIGPMQLRAVLLNAGPGGFTGLRIAHAAAQAIAIATGAHIVQVGAAACARQASCDAGDIVGDDAVWVALASKGEEAWVARVHATDNAMCESGESISAAQWQPRGASLLIADEHLPAAWRSRAQAENIRLIPLRVHASAVIKAGMPLLAQGLHTPPEAAIPIYPREAEAVRLWRQRHAVRTDGTA